MQQQLRDAIGSTWSNISGASFYLPVVLLPSRNIWCCAHLGVPPPGMESEPEACCRSAPAMLLAKIKVNSNVQKSFPTLPQKCSGQQDTSPTKKQGNNQSWMFTINSVSWFSRQISTIIYIIYFAVGWLKWGIACTAWLPCIHSFIRLFIFLHRRLRKAPGPPYLTSKNTFLAYLYLFPLCAYHFHEREAHW